MIKPLAVIAGFKAIKLLNSQRKFIFGRENSFRFFRNIAKLQTFTNKVK